MIPVYGAPLGELGYGNRFAPNFAVKPALFSAEECERLIERFTMRQAEDAGLVGEVSMPDIRRTDVIWLKGEGADEWVMRRMMGFVADINREAFDYVLGGFDEALQLTRYRAEERGHYDWHSDRGGQGFGRFRKLTVVVQLSIPESYEGGMLEVNATGREEAMPRERGAAIVFPSYVLHRVTPVTKGVRHSLVTWVHGPSFR
ncbi:hypothetical protein GR183_07195 [Stappia sp. GBMRC 2046]|uniref:Fe2OG dioxygenase domain-containing protein n=1 Tax=Stappia sediminis TaxID=2692190 RepID=A0A7X3LTA3_9HYPH|nr:2OG-Fe(II) oxygenase [Stappia sediminis]MXN64686.1 hypothetical protein [Stappia sediminis]